MAGQPLNSAWRARIGYSLGPDAFEFPIASTSTADCHVTLASNFGASAAIVVELNRSDVLSIAFTTEPLGIVSSQLDPEKLNTVGCLFAEGRDRLAGRLPAPVRDSSPRPPLRKREPGRGIADRYTVIDNALEVATAPAEPPNVRSHTRIRPPCDVIRLEDRLRLLLEPPLESLLAAGSLRFAFPPFPYQLDGVAFLYPRHQALLADEMGLGKTMQAITAMRLLIHQRQLRRVLLVCPKSLVTNWQREFALWAPEINATVVDGHPDRRRWLWREAASVVSIANYETVVRDRSEVCDSARPFDLVVLDESQRIKNAVSTTNEVVRSITRGRSWALTGTPIENSIDDLAGIFEFVAPDRIKAEMKPRAVRQAVHDYVLRRTKERVLCDLPPKLFRDVDIELTPEQWASYQLAQDEGIVRLRNLKLELTIQHVFELVLRLKQICNFDPTTRSSSKLERLEADLDECAGAAGKAIVFSQWVETLQELRSRLARFNPVEYHGRVPNGRRDAVIAKFRDDPQCQVILMSYGAGSVGLNLQFASYVFLFDRWWNPAVEDQAINRAHRIGAKTSVTVTRFLTLATIEQRINQILEQKRALFESIFNQTNTKPHRGLSRDEIFSLFDLPMPAAGSRRVE